LELFNELRLYEISEEYKIKANDNGYYLRALSKGLVDNNGAPIEAKESNLYRYEGENGLYRYFYFKEMLSQILNKIGVNNISDHLDKGSAGTFILPNDYIFVHGSHQFRSITNKQSGKGQICSGTRRAQKVEISYTFDKWEATSASAWGAWLSGTQSCGSLVHVKNITRENDSIVVQGTVLGISTGTNELKKREYANQWLSYQYQNDDSDFED